MKCKFNLQLFADGGEGGAGGQGGGAGSGNGGQGNTGGATFSFEQAEEIANARAERAEKAALKSYFQQQGMSEEEVNRALAEYRANKEKNKPDVAAIEKERDDAKKDLENYKNNELLRKKGVKEEDIDYVFFKVSKNVTDKISFEKAAEQFLKENPRFAGGGYRVVNGSGATGSEGSSGGKNMSINDAIRFAAKR